MSFSKEQKHEADVQALEKLITAAIKKINGQKENDICRYLPVPTGGYMHHFTLRKMKQEAPDELAEMIQQFVINPKTPITVAPKPRAARGSRKRRDNITLNKNDLERMLSIARMAGDKEMIAKLTPKKSLAAIKRELIASIRKNEINYTLWAAYVETTSGQSTTGIPGQESHMLLQRPTMPNQESQMHSNPAMSGQPTAQGFANAAPARAMNTEMGNNNHSQNTNQSANNYAAARITPAVSSTNS